MRAALRVSARKIKPGDWIDCGGLGIPIEDAPDVEPTLESDLADGWDAWWREVDEVADRFERGRR